MSKIKKLVIDPGISGEAKGIIIGNNDRALWLHLLIEAAEHQNTDIEKLTDEALYRYGVESFSKLKARNARDFVGIMSAPGSMREVFDAEAVKMDEDHAIGRFHFCPLVYAWQKYGLSDERIDYLCQLACKGDYGRASNFPIKLTFTKQISKGDPYCELDVVTKKD